MPLHSRLPWLDPAARALAWSTAALTVVLITVGGLVTNTDSGLACPDWPTCFGTPFPKLVGGVLMEHGHRYIATAVGFLVVLLVLATLLDRARLLALMLLVSMPLILGGGTWAGIAKHKTGGVPAFAIALVLAGYAIGLVSTFLARGAGRHSQAALLLVITQGLLGGVTVMYQLPPTILVLHLATSMLFLAVLLWLCVRIQATAPATGHSQSPKSPGGEAARPNPQSPLLPLATAAIYLQIILGAAVRHTGAGLVCTEWLCRGALWPTNVHPAVHLHMTHRAFALVAGALAIAAAIQSRRNALHANDRRAARVALAIPLLVLTQLALGIATIWSLKEVWAVTAHLFVAALILSSCAWLWAHSLIGSELSVAAVPQSPTSPGGEAARPNPQSPTSPLEATA